jgi:hypothetical protein
MHHNVAICPSQAQCRDTIGFAAVQNVSQKLLQADASTSDDAAASGTSAAATHAAYVNDAEVSSWYVHRLHPFVRIILAKCGCWQDEIIWQRLHQKSAQVRPEAAQRAGRGRHAGLRRRGGAGAGPLRACRLGKDVSRLRSAGRLGPDSRGQCACHTATVRRPCMQHRCEQCIGWDQLQSLAAVHLQRR